MPFAKPEHEVLRLTAMAEPDWDQLRAVISEGIGWDYTRQAALLHQLDGVLAWRCVDERLNGAVPKGVQADCAGGIDGLNEIRPRWAEAASTVAGALDAAAVPWFYFGFPQPYQRYGMDPEAFPRDGRSLGFWASPAHFTKAKQVAQSLGEDPERAEWDFTDDFGLGLYSVTIKSLRPPYAAGSYTGYSLTEEWFAAGQPQEVYGVTLRVLRPEAQAVVRAFEICRCFACGAPVSMCELAHIHNLLTLVGFDVNACLDFLKLAQAHGNRLMVALAQERQARASEPAQAAVADAVLARPGAWNPARHIVWAWELTARVYPGSALEGMLVQAQQIAGRETPWLPSMGELLDPLRGRHRIAAMEAWPEPERLLFEYRHTLTLADRVAAGILALPLGDTPVPLWVRDPVGLPGDYEVL